MDHEPTRYYVEEARTRRIVWVVAGGIWNALRFLLYMVLMLLRVPVQILATLLSFPLVGLGFFWGLVAGWHSQAFLWMVGTGVGLWVAAFLFDTILLRIAPEKLYLET